MAITKTVDGAGNVTYSDTARLQKDMQAIVGQPTPAKTLQRRDAAAPLPAAVGAAKPKLSGSQRASGGSIASPITEQSRTSHAAKSMTSSDGLFTLFYQNVNEITAEDAYGKTVVMAYLDP